MKKFIIPEINIAKFSTEIILTNVSAVSAAEEEVKKLYGDKSWIQKGEFVKFSF